MVGQQVSAEELQLVQKYHKTATLTTVGKSGFYLFSSALAAIAITLSACAPASETARLNRRTLAQSNAILDDLARTELMLSPEAVTEFGIETSGEDGLAARLADHSQAGFERARLIRIDLLARARTRPRLPADHQVAKDLDVADAAIASLVKLQAIGHGRLTLSRAHPYAIDPYSGVWIEGPSLLVNDHRIDSFEDAQDYLARLQALPGAIDDSRRRLLADADAGLIPPIILLQETKHAVDALASSEDEPLELLADTARNLMLDLPDADNAEVADLVRQSEMIAAHDLRNAYVRLSSELDSMIERAPAQAGLWAQPNGHDTYQALLNWYVGTTPTLDQIHQANLDNVEQRQAALHASLDQHNIPPGPLTVRVLALQDSIDFPQDNPLNPDPASPTDTETEVIEQPASRDTVHRVYAASSLTGYTYLPARFDGQRPAQINENVTRAQAWPSYMQTAIYAEADMARREPFATLSRQRRATIRGLITYPAFQDAWHLYTLETQPNAVELPRVQDVGQAQYLLVLTALAAADTGLHHERWSFEQTMTYLGDTTGLGEELVREAVLRMTANPGRATARMITYRRLKALNARARAVLGGRYNEHEFQAVLLVDGPRPFTLVEQDVDDWYNELISPRN